MAGSRKVRAIALSRVYRRKSCAGPGVAGVNARLPDRPEDSGVADTWMALTVSTNASGAAKWVMAGSGQELADPGDNVSAIGLTARKSGWLFTAGGDRSGDGELRFYSSTYRRGGCYAWAGSNCVVALRTSPVASRVSLTSHGDTIMKGSIYTGASGNQKGITTNYTLKAGDKLQIQNGIIVGINPAAEAGKPQ
jgi:hypothetical protein